MGTLAERLDALLVDLTEEEVKAEIECCEARLAVLRSLAEHHSRNGAAQPRSVKIKRKREPSEPLPKDAVSGRRKFSSREVDDLRIKLGEFLHEHGQARSDRLQRHLGVNYIVLLDEVFACPWFEKDVGGMWKLTNEGWTFFKEAADNAVAG